MSQVIIHAHLDGKVFVPDEPVELPVGQEFRLKWNQRTRLRVSRRCWNLKRICRMLPLIYPHGTITI